MIREIQLRYRDQAGAERVLWLAGQARCEHAGIALSARTELISGGGIAYAQVENASGQPARLGWLGFELDTGFDSASSARFFKHGYQSWSASYPTAVGHAGHHENRPLLARISHQSETERPEGAPENATSELFTVVESDSSHEHFLAGFIGAANQFTTITVISPGRIIARALFDGAWLRPGETLAVEPLAYWRSDQDAARMAAQWAELLGKRMSARINAPYQRGWCSWYHYFDTITEDTLRSNLRRLRELRREFPVDVVQLDDGFQAALGDWDRTNAKFPSGLRMIADEIRKAGFIAGLWTAPFLAARDSNLMRAHPHWFIRNQNDEPLAAAHNPNWTAGEDKFAYALDPSHPEFTQHHEQLFHRLVHEFGYGYLKLDFMFAAAADGRRHDPNLTRAQTLRRGLETIRRGAGDETFLLGCGCPFGPAIGVVDGMRIGPDVAPYWGGDAEPGTRLAINAIIARSFMHRRLWLNDPDCLMLRVSDTRLSREERFALAAAITISGGMLLFSDDMNLLGQDNAKLLRMVAGVGMEVDNASGREPPLAGSLMHDTAMLTLVAQGRHGVLYLLLNTAEIPKEVSLAAILPAFGRAQLIGPDGESDAPVTIELPAHSGRIIRC
ncbi:MAG: alpha-galactosidase [Deltaproteobacteria bacterium]|nr:alpha-galactosidase [Deltaproteobacteria bacterium]